MTPDAFPRSPDVAERETLDGGFSRGWGFHFQANEAAWVDAHAHMGSTTTRPLIYRTLEERFGRLDAFRLGRVVAIVKQEQGFEAFRDLAAQDSRFAWLYWMPFDKPDAALARKALEHGARGLKLHNSPLMSGVGAAGPQVWLSDPWRRVFEVLAEAGLPVLWHVTQRMSASPYHGGDAQSYFKDGWKKGLKWTNEDYLSVFLQLAEQYRRIPFIGAHQCYLGHDRLSALFEAHPNLYIDTSIGFFVRWADVLCEEDRAVLGAFVREHEDRILFGTDASLAPGASDEYQVQAFLCHARCIRQLRLPDGPLQKVAHANAERLFQLEPTSTRRRGNSRP